MLLQHYIVFFIVIPEFMSEEMYNNFLPSLTTSKTKPFSWPLKRIAEIPGDLTIGGLHMVHEREDKMTCGPIMPQGGLQAAEVMLYTVDIINRRKILPGGLLLGAYILDDCDKDTYGLLQAVDFIKGSISNINEGEEYRCEDGSSPQVQNKVISGVVGASSSVTSIQVANLLKLFKIPQVSFFSTSPELSNKERFEFFSRTIPSDHYQTLVMAKIIEQLGWKYMSIVYEESNYGIKAFEELNRLLTARGVCLAIKMKLTKDSGVAGSKFYDDIIAKLREKPKARGVIVFGSDQEVAELMKAVKRSNATGQFSWIGSDGWSARALVSDGHEAEVEGTLSVQPQSNQVMGFREYFLNLTIKSNQRNPWFVEFWEDHFQCRFLPGIETPYNQHYDKICTGDEKLTGDNTQFEAQLQFVSDAVMAFAHALRNMHEAICGQNYVGLCPEMKPVNGEYLLKYLRNVDFVGLSGDRFRFNEQGDGPARYNIIHFKQVKPGVYKWVTVGDFRDEEIRLNLEKLQFGLNNPYPPESICSQPCRKGEMKKNMETGCCWTCHQCGDYEVLDTYDDTRCLPCPLGMKPDPEHTVCESIPEVYMKSDSYWAITAVTFSLFGVIFTCTALIVFIKNNDTPIVRASGRELSYVLLFGALLSYSVTFIFMIRPSNRVCATQEFMIGLCFSIIFGALLTKTNRLSRIFNASNQKLNCISPKSQLAICAGLVFVQILINGVSFFISPPQAVHHYPTREDNLLICRASLNSDYIVSFTYPIILVVICTIYAVLTRKIPEAFNESKFIGFSMYTTCIIWLAFIPIYFSTRHNADLRIISMSFTISLTATVTVACLIVPKLYIIILHPEKNIRQSIMNKNKFSSAKIANDKSNQRSLKKPPHLIRRNGGLKCINKLKSMSTQTSNAHSNHSTQTMNYLCSAPPLSFTQEVADVTL